jgi:hypothetical protein
MPKPGANSAAALAAAHGDGPVKRRPWIGLAALAVLLAACHRPAVKDQTAAASVAVGPERAGPVRWNATTAALSWPASR